MQYIFLRGIIDNAITNFACPQCQKKADEQSLFLTGMTSQGVDINIHCSGCHTNTLLHAEINSIAGEMMNSEHGQNFIKEFLEKGGAFSAQIPIQQMSAKNENSIKDEDITEMYKNLKNINSVEDMLGDNL